MRHPLLLAAVLVAALPAVATAAPPVAFTNTGTDCRNLAVSGEMDPAVARELVPERFTLTDPPQGFVELATCAGGTLDGRPLGAFRLAEAAVNVVTPAASPGIDGVITQDIYALSQLDTNAELSARKRSVGFRSELVDIRFTADSLGTRIDAEIPWAFSPYTMGADLTPSSPPVPGLDLITRIWGLGDKGLVVTRNDIHRVRSGSAGIGTATFAAGSPLARLFGTTTLTGTAIAGRGDFVNHTRIIEPVDEAATTGSPAGASVTARILRPARRGGRTRLEIRVSGTDRARVVATIRRAGRTVRTLRGRPPLRWSGTTRAGRAVAPGDYTVRVGTIDTLRVRVTRRGPSRLLP